MRPERLAWLGLALALLFSACSTDEAPSRARQCAKLRDHLIDLRLANATGVDHAAHRKTMQRALGDDFVASCERLAERQLECALGAKELAAATACTAAAATK